MMIRIAVVACFSALTMVAGHYFNWRGLLGRPLGRIAAYIYGVAGIISPLVVLFHVLGWYEAMLAILAASAASGIAVVGCYMVDALIERNLLRLESEEMEALHESAQQKKK